MENRVTSKFVVDGSHLLEVDARQSLESLLLSAMGANSSSKAHGRVVKITVTLETTSDKPWPVCDSLGYYKDSTCGTLNPPGVPCTETHYHRPNWSPFTNDDTPQTCHDCETLGVEPSRNPDADGYYNHSNKGA